VGKETTFPPAFPTTRWTRLLQIRDSGMARSREQLQTLFTLYLPVVRSAVLRDWTRDPHEAGDLTQEFFLSLLERDFSRDLSPDKGRFRHFMKAALKNFLLNRRRDGSRLKRGGGANVVSMDDVDPAAPADDGFDRTWAQVVLSAGMERLRGRCGTTDRGIHFEALRLHHEESMTYPTIAQKLGVSPFDVGNHIKWARAELRRIVLDVIAEYAGSPEAARQELEDLFR